MLRLAPPRIGWCSRPVALASDIGTLNAMEGFQSSAEAVASRGKTVGIPLGELVASATNRDFLIPPLQRAPVWGTGDQRQLLGSVLAGRPIGSLLTVGQITGIDGADAIPLGMQFGIDRRAPGSAHGFAEGDEGGGPQVPRSYVLDGQQRLITLASAFMPASTRPGRPRSFHSEARIWYLDLDKLLGLMLAQDADRSDMCLAIERALHWKQPSAMSGCTAQKLAGAYIRAAKQGKAFRVQLGMLLASSDWASAGLEEILNLFERSVAGDEPSALCARKVVSLLRSVRDYHVPVFQLASCSAIEAASIFERINRTGADLTSGQVANALIFVRSATVRRRLTELAQACAAIGSKAGQQGLAGVSEEEILLAAICAGTERSAEFPSLRADALLRFIKREDGVGVAHIARGLSRVEAALEPVGSLLFRNCVAERRRWPVPAVVIAMLAAISRVPDPAAFLSIGVNKNRLSRWWWEQSLLPENVGATHTAVTRLCASLQSFTFEGQPPTNEMEHWSLKRFQVDPDKIKAGARGKLLLALLRYQRPRDFRDWQTRGNDEPLDLHHVFPKAWLTDKGLLRRGDCFTNFALIVQGTNRNVIRALAPSEYLGKLMSEAGSRNAHAHFAKVLSEHGIAIEHLEANDFEAFMDFRKRWFDRLIRQLGRDLAT